MFGKLLPMMFGKLLPMIAIAETTIHTSIGFDTGSQLWVVDANRTFLCDSFLQKVEKL